jgi:hypothetical protein
LHSVQDFSLKRVWTDDGKLEREFLDIVKKLIAFSERCLEIKEKLREIYEGSNPAKTV